MAVRVPPITPIWSGTNRHTPRTATPTIAIGVPNMNNTIQKPTHVPEPAAGAGLMVAGPKMLDVNITRYQNPFDAAKPRVRLSSQTLPPPNTAPMIRMHTELERSITAVPVVVIEEPELDFAPVDAALLLCADAVQQARLGAPSGELESVDDAVTLCLGVIAHEVQKLNLDKSSSCSRLSLWQQPEHTTKHMTREPMSEETAVALSRKQAAEAAAEPLCGKFVITDEHSTDATAKHTARGSKARLRKSSVNETAEFVPPVPRNKKADRQAALAAQELSLPNKQMNASAPANGDVLHERINSDQSKGKTTKKSGKISRPAGGKAFRPVQPPATATMFTPPAPKPRE